MAYSNNRAYIRAYDSCHSQDQAWFMHGGDAVPFNAMLENGPPDWLSKSLLGPNIPKLRGFLRKHPNRKLVGAHKPLDLYDIV